MIRRLPFALALVVSLSLVACGDDDTAAPDGGSLDGGSLDGSRLDGAPPTGDCDSPCADPNTPICVDGVCEACSSAEQCLAQQDLPQCRADGRCAECLEDSHCTELLPFCDDGTCRECATDDHCPAQEPACDSGSCRSCADGSCTPEQALREFLAMYCRALTALESENEFFDALQPVYCSGRASLSPILGPIRRALDEGRVEIDVEQLVACREGGLLDAAEACDRVIRPTVEVGGECAIDEECTSNDCRLAAGACTGTCAATSGTGAPGTPCTGDAQCVAGLRCISSACAIPPGEGESCGTACAEGLFCNSSRICERPRAAGSPCNEFSVARQCAEGLQCIGDVCSAPPGEGETCWPPDLRFFRCADGLRCIGTTCQVPSPRGAACTDTAQCEAGLRCHRGACATILGLDEACTATSACARGTGCQGGRCRPLPDVGEPCGAAGCLRGECRDGRCQDLAPGATCEGAGWIFDLLDPCGSSSSCQSTDSGLRCVAELGLGERCDRVGTPYCRAPDLTCSSAGYCVAECWL